MTAHGASLYRGGMANNISNAASNFSNDAKIASRSHAASGAAAGPVVRTAAGTTTRGAMPTSATGAGMAAINADQVIANRILANSENGFLNTGFNAATLSRTAAGAIDLNPVQTFNNRISSDTIVDPRARDPRFLAPVVNPYLGYPSRLVPPAYGYPGYPYPYAGARFTGAIPPPYPGAVPPYPGYLAPVGGPCGVPPVAAVPVPGAPAVGNCYNCVINSNGAGFPY